MRPDRTSPSSPASHRCESVPPPPSLSGGYAPLPTDRRSERGRPRPFCVDAPGVPARRNDRARVRRALGARHRRSARERELPCVSDRPPILRRWSPVRGCAVRRIGIDMKRAEKSGSVCGSRGLRTSKALSRPALPCLAVPPALVRPSALGALGLRAEHADELERNHQHPDAGTGEGQQPDRANLEKRGGTENRLRELECLDLRLWVCNGECHVKRHRHARRITRSLTRTSYITFAYGPAHRPFRG